MNPVALSCSACGATVHADDRFCEQCGVRLDEDRDELDLSVAAAVTDRGRVHESNEDAFHVATTSDRAVAAVVCDGISSAAAADVAARRAAEVAGAALVDGLVRGGADLVAVTTAAFAAAQQAVLAVAASPRPGAEEPACTIVTAALRGREVVVGWVGDSRAYWLGPDNAALLTVDDSWANEQVVAGHLTEAQARIDRRAHAVTRWLGSDAPDEPPNVVTHLAREGGRLLLCSDGLWNYAPTARELAELVAQLPARSAALVVARALTDFAVAEGGRDNVTVVVIDVQPPREEAV
jgi:serine/threonine protein phosphatase PrpC